MAPSSWRPPWFETMMPERPCERARWASATDWIPLRTIGPSQLAWRKARSCHTNRRQELVNMRVLKTYLPRPKYSSVDLPKPSHRHPTLVCRLESLHVLLGLGSHLLAVDGVRESDRTAYALEEGQHCLVEVVWTVSEERGVECDDQSRESILLGAVEERDGNVVRLRPTIHRQYWAMVRTYLRPTSRADTIAVRWVRSLRPDTRWNESLPWTCTTGLQSWPQLSRPPPLRPCATHSCLVSEARTRKRRRGSPKVHSRLREQTRRVTSTASRTASCANPSCSHRRASSGSVPVVPVSTRSFGPDEWGSSQVSTV
jgi:hypothetical protein